VTRKKKKKRPLKDRIVIWISIILMVISVLSVAVVALWNFKLFQGINGSVVNDKDILGNQDDGNDNKNPNLGNQKQVNFLICGLDESEQMTDIIMLACIDLGNNTVNVLQIPRDTYVEKGVGSTNKINSAYSSGDKSLTPINRLIKVINEQYKLKVDHYATVTIESFRNIVDAIGGVPIDMPYSVGNSQYGIIPKGYQVLDGEHAEWLVRHRHTYYDQDIGRMKIQRLFLASALQQVKKIGFKEVTKLIPALYGQVTTDLSLSEASEYAKLAFSINLDSINMFLVPGEGVTYKGQSVWSMHYYETADMLNKYFRPYTDDVPAEELGIVEIAHTGEYYEDTQDDLQDLLDGTKPGEKKNDSSEPAYTHIVTPKTEYTTTATEEQTTQTSTETSPSDTTTASDTTGTYSSDTKQSTSSQTTKDSQTSTGTQTSYDEEDDD